MFRFLRFSSDLGFAIAKTPSEKEVPIAIISRKLSRSKDTAHKLTNTTSCECDFLTRDAEKSIIETVGPSISLSPIQEDLRPYITAKPLHAIKTLSEESRKKHCRCL